MKKGKSKEVHWFEKLESDIADTPPGRPEISTEEWELLRGSLVFEKHLIETYRWVHELGLHLGLKDQPRAVYRLLRSALYALRDRLPPEEVFQLAAQFPQHLRGIFFDQYTISGKPDKMSAADLLSRIEEAGAVRIKKSATEIFTATLQLLYHHVSKGEMDDIYATMPDDIKKLWDEAFN